MQLIYLDELVSRMDHPTRSKTLLTALRKEIRDGLIDGGELEDDITLPGTGDTEYRTKQLVLVKTPHLEEWFAMTNMALQPPKRRFRRPSKAQVEQGETDLAALFEKTRETYRSQAEAGKATQARLRERTGNPT